MERLGHQNPTDEQAVRLPAYPPSKAFVQRPKWYNACSPWRLIWSLILILIYLPSTRRLIRLLPRNWLNTARSSTAGAQQQSGAAQGWPRIREGGVCWCRTWRGGQLLLNGNQQVSTPQQPFPEAGLNPKVRRAPATSNDTRDSAAPKPDRAALAFGAPLLYLFLQFKTQNG
jgi:hypothetical protein